MTIRTAAPRHRDQAAPNAGHRKKRHRGLAVKTATFLLNATDEELLAEGRRLEVATRQHPIPPHVIGGRVHSRTSALRAIRASLRKLKAADPSWPLFT